MTYSEICLQDARCVVILPSHCCCLASECLGTRGALDGLADCALLGGDLVPPANLRDPLLALKSRVRQ